MNHSTPSIENSAHYTVLTGATGGIGRAIAEALFEQGDSLLLVARSRGALEQLQQQLLQSSAVAAGGNIHILAADLTRDTDRQRLVQFIEDSTAVITRLINNAGINEFALCSDQSADAMDAIVHINSLAPMQLTRQLLPYFSQQASAQIINVGSTFGSIGHPGYSSYCASKFALRGFTEALQREYADSTVSIRYFAPRATKTALNSANAEQLNAELNVHMDAPEVVADALLEFLQNQQVSHYLGWPEKLLVRLNQLFPALIGYFIRQNLSAIRYHARQNVLASH